MSSPSQLSRVEIPFYATTVATNATQTVRIDLSTFDAATVDVIHQAATATNASARFAACELRFGDTTTYASASSAARFVGATQTNTSGNFVMPVHNDTSNPYVVRFNVDRARLGGGARYLFVAATPVASHTLITVRADLSKGDVGADADSTSSRNVRVSVNG